MRNNKKKEEKNSWYKNYDNNPFYEYENVLDLYGNILNPLLGTLISIKNNATIIKDTGDGYSIVNKEKRFHTF